MTRLSLPLAALAIAGLTSTALAADVEARLQSGALSFSGGAGFTNAHLKVTGPDDFEAEETASRGLPVFRLQGGRMRDGFYHYALTAATDEKVKITRQFDNGRGDNARDFRLKPFHLTGMFQVKNGTIVPQEKMDGGADGDSEG